MVKLNLSWLGLFHVVRAKLLRAQYTYKYRNVVRLIEPAFVLFPPSKCDHTSEINSTRPGVCVYFMYQWLSNEYKELMKILTSVSVKANCETGTHTGVPYLLERQPFGFKLWSVYLNKGN